LSTIALVPARSGSSRLPHKNIRPLQEIPLLNWTIQQCVRAKIFDAICVSSDSQEYLDIASNFYPVTRILRPESLAGTESPDIGWVKHAISNLSFNPSDKLMILRPTSPFRKPETINTGMNLFMNSQSIDSLRAVKKVSEHPGKMWTLSKELIHPLFPFSIGEVPWHSNQTHALPEVYVQTASLEITTVESVNKFGSIAGERVMPQIVQGRDALDINTLDDFMYAVYLLTKNSWKEELF
jgi:CMP-N,N'-diacetyllegionaminic acid synthase